MQEKIKTIIIISNIMIHLFMWLILTIIIIQITIHSCIILANIGQSTEIADL